MKLFFLIGFIFCSCLVHSQQKMDSNKMNYIYTSHPYCLLYHDTLFSGSKAFRNLFYRTGNAPIISLYKLHQNCKIWGNGLTLAGSLGIIWGLAKVSDKSSSSSQRNLGWFGILGGISCDIGGEALILSGQKALATAVHLFNLKNSKTSVDLGIGHKEAGLVLNW